MINGTALSFPACLRGLSCFLHSLALSIWEGGCFRFGVPTGPLNSSLKKPEVSASPIWRNLELELKLYQGLGLEVRLSPLESC